MIELRQSADLQRFAWFCTPEIPLRRCGWIVLGLCLLCAIPGFAQQAALTPEPAPTEATEAETIEPETAEPEPIPASEISDRVADARSLLREIASDLAALEDLRTIEERYAAEKTQLEILRRDSLERLKDYGPPSVLVETQKEWLRVEARFDGWSQDLTSRADAISSLMDRLEDEKGTWEAARDESTAAELPEELKQTIREVLESIAEVEQDLRSARDDTLSLQARIGEEKAEIEEILADHRGEISRRQQALFRIDSPPLWRVSVGVEEAHLIDQITATWRSAESAVRAYVAENGPRLLRQTALLLALVAALIAMHPKARVWTEEDPSLEPTAGLLDRPVATALVISVVYVYLADPTAPRAWVGLLGLILITAGLRLASPMAGSSRRSWAWALASLLVLWFLHTVTPAGSALSRLALLLLSLFGVLACVWFARVEGPDTVAGSSRLLRAVQIGNRLAGALFVIGAIANVVGSVGLATFVTSGTLRATSAALVLWLVALVLQGMVSLGLHTGAARQLGLVGGRAKTVRETLFPLVRWLTVAVWVLTALRGFLLLNPVISFLRNILETEVALGKFALAPADILIFALVVWLSYKLSQFIRFVLDTSVYDRVDLPRGAPDAISTLTHYTVMVAGVLAAFSAAGFDLSRVTIMFGALGVGIGFGLQNIVSNFVSGLILLFERPIKVGDVIELDSSLGVVKDIAIRASVVSTYDGAEIIVPNSDLISTRVVNWTYRNDRTRVKLPLRVAYGTDSALVIELLERVARKHPEVLETPAPVGLLLDYGEDTLNFELRFWTAWNVSTKVSSQLRVSVAEALTEAGIEIPVPQREVHLHSITGEESSERDAGNPELNSQDPPR
jgi:small-conductance mechanosensitive channel